MERHQSHLMLSAGEIKFPVIPPANIPIDLDFPEITLPMVSTCPVARQTCNDQAYLQTVELANGRRALRVQLNSEVGGLFGRKGGGWSHYAIYLEEGGKIYARKAKGSNPNEDTKQYHLNHPAWKGSSQRITELLAEMVAGWETMQRLRSPAEVRENPAYQLAFWLEENKTEAFHYIPEPLILGFLAFVQIPTQVAIDLDDNRPQFPPSLGVVSVATKTTNDRVSVRLGGSTNGAAIRCHFASEVSLQELGAKPSLNPFASRRDKDAKAVVELGARGIKIFDAANPSIELASETPPDRLALILAGAMVAVGNKASPLTFAPPILQGANRVATAGVELPTEARFVPGRGLPKEEIDYVPTPW